MFPLRELRRLMPPGTPSEAIASRRNPCYGFCVLVNIEEHEGLIAMLRGTLCNILGIIDPERDSKPRPVKSPLYIKQKFFHAAIFGMAPLLVEDEYKEHYTSPQGLVSPRVISNMCRVLQGYLSKQKPYLVPVGYEIMRDGTILARFLYKTSSEEDEKPLMTLTDLLDLEENFPRWDPENEARNKTVTVAVCVIDTHALCDHLPAINEILRKATIRLKTLAKVDISMLDFIEHYNKRTLSIKHIDVCAVIDEFGVTQRPHIK